MTVNDWASAVVAYCGQAPAPGQWLSAWTTEPALWGAMLAWGLLTWAGCRRLPGARHLAWRRQSAWAAWALAAAIYLSPLCAMSAALFSVRVVHHVLLLVGVAPLLALASLPPVPASGPHRSTPAWQVVAATSALALVVWAWHWPALYQFGLTDFSGYWLMQASLLGVAWAFWRCALDARTPAMAAVLSLLATAAQMGLLGALIAFSRQSLYPLHSASTLAWGISPQSDQQLGGLIMWVPAALPFLIAGLWRVARQFRGRSLPGGSLGAGT